MQFEETIEIKVSLARWNNAKCAVQEMSELLNKSSGEEKIWNRLCENLCIINEVFEQTGSMSQDKDKGSQSMAENDSILSLSSVMGPKSKFENENGNISESPVFDKTVEYA